MRIGIFAILLFSVVCSITAHVQTNGAQKALANELPTKYFSADYEEARNKFLDASRSVGASIESIRHPNTGPKGKPLYTDVAFIGPKQANRILMLVSGTHGIEGFTGSGIQTGLLREGIASRLDSDRAIVMVHAINPYGFAYMRRVNEDNVDLNRNFVDHSLPYPENPGYEKLSSAIAPQSLSYYANLASNSIFLWYRLVEGKDHLKCAITAGQYSHPEGLFYGGNTVTWSNKAIRNIVNTYLSQAESVAIIGLHTGLGPYGEGEIILNEPMETPAYQRAVGWWGAERTRTTVAGESVSCNISGPLKLAYAKMLPNAEVTAVSLEFGTFPGKEVFAAMRAENWLHHYDGNDSADAIKIKNEMVRMFYPDSDDWKSRVWFQGKEVADQALIGLK